MNIQGIATASAHRLRNDLFFDGLSTIHLDGAFWGYSKQFFRSGPGTSYSKIATNTHGNTVMLLSAANGWIRVLYHGTKLGYVSSQYLAGVSEGYSAVSISVPSFKQTDSRWASCSIGTTGGTIETIGCATTAIAMMESCRTGTTVYPNAMAKKLSYTADGSVYWPSHYTVSTSTGYLTAIYNLLKQGKPVLFGAKARSGRQHWVVITALPAAV